MLCFHSGSPFFSPFPFQSFPPVVTLACRLYFHVCSFVLAIHIHSWLIRETFPHTPWQACPPPLNIVSAARLSALLCTVCVCVELFVLKDGSPPVLSARSVLTLTCSARLPVGFCFLAFFPLSCFDGWSMAVNVFICTEHGMTHLKHAYDKPYS